jgi:hypothetical protein
MSLTSQLTVPSPMTYVVPLMPFRLAVAHGRRGPRKSARTGVTDTEAPVSITIRTQSYLCALYTDAVVETASPVIIAADRRA